MMTAEIGRAAAPQEWEEQIESAAASVEETVRRTLGTGKIHPHLMVMAVAKVTGELTAAFATAGGYDLEELLGDITEIMRRSGRGYHGVQAEVAPVAGVVPVTEMESWA